MSAEQIVAGLIGEEQVSEEVRAYLLSLAAEEGYGALRPFRLKVVEPDFVLVATSRDKYSEIRGRGGVAKFTGAGLFYKGQVQFQEWQWRDQWYESNDRSHLDFGNFGEVRLSKSGETVVIEVELINYRFGPRCHEFHIETNS